MSKITKTQEELISLMKKLSSKEKEHFLQKHKEALLLRPDYDFTPSDLLKAITDLRNYIKFRTIWKDELNLYKTTYTECIEIYEK